MKPLWDSGTPMPKTAPDYSAATFVNRPLDTDISNWRHRPHSAWAFQHVREILPTAPIQATASQPLVADLQDFSKLDFQCPTGCCGLDDLLRQSYSDGLLVLHKAKIVYRWNAAHFDPGNPHIVFSISKSITAMLAGILEGQGVIHSEAPIVDYLPGAKAGVYGGCRIRHLLDMTVALDFAENYTDPHSEYIQYRKATAWNPVDQNAPGPGLETFLYSLPRSADEHGRAFLYRSPNSDLLGLLLERAAGETLANLFAKYLWQPMAATMSGYITLERFGAPRGAGGICIGIEDLTRLGQLFLDNGKANGQRVVPVKWIEDTCNHGDQSVWDRGNYKQKLPNYTYRNQWYQIQNSEGEICARGIHGQLLYINPARCVVIARLASHPEPLNDITTSLLMAAFDKIAKQF